MPKPLHYDPANPQNVESLTVGHTLKSRMDLSGALELGANAAQGVVEVLVERGGPVTK